MKKLLLFSALIFLGILSCKKEDTQPEDNSGTNNSNHLVRGESYMIINGYKWNNWKIYFNDTNVLLWHSAYYDLYFDSALTFNITGNSKGKVDVGVGTVGAVDQFSFNTSKHSLGNFSETYEINNDTELFFDLFDEKDSLEWYQFHDGSLSGKITRLDEIRGLVELEFSGSVYEPLHWNGELGQYDSVNISIQGKISTIIREYDLLQ